MKEKKERWILIIHHYASMLLCINYDLIYINIYVMNMKICIEK